MLLRRPYYFSLCLGLSAILYVVPGHATQDIDLTATVTNNTCRLEVNDNGVVRLPTVNLKYFADNITAETDYPGGKEFTIRLVDCPVQDGNISQVMMNFLPQTGSFPAGNSQVFANDLAANDYGAKNIGLAIFTNQPNVTRTNVLNSDGTSRVIYPVTAENYKNSLWTFYARMQRILSADNISSGLLSSKVLVSISYL